MIAPIGPEVKPLKLGLVVRGTRYKPGTRPGGVAFDIVRASTNRRR